MLPGSKPVPQIRIPLGVFCGVLILWAVSIAKIRLGGLPNRNHLST